MLSSIIEDLRRRLYEVSKEHGIASNKLLELSREFEQYTNFYHRVNTKSYNPFSPDAKVHSNAIQNILEVANKEKLQLPSFIINDKKFFEEAWFQMDLVNYLLFYIEKNHGKDAVEYIGAQVPKHCFLPDSIQYFKDSIQTLDNAFHLNHKSSKFIGEYLPYMDTKNEVVLFCNTPYYPAHFNLGLVKGLATKFNSPLKIALLDEENGGQFKISV
ncbi:aspartyl-phosphate phosphatase Spo0E family protein [Cytobacillus suaedae]|nr:aspartyl-phosphate phosphatase Spo0E family protein [Cytobacillus suaedae]